MKKSSWLREEGSCGASVGLLRVNVYCRLGLLTATRVRILPALVAGAQA